MKTLAVSFACMIFIVGGASNYTVGPKESGDDYDFEQFNKHIDYQKCTILLSTGKEMKVDGIISSKDSVTWISPSKMSISVPKSKISQIQPDLSSHKNEKIITFINGLSKKVDAIISTPDSISWMEPILLTVSVPTSHITKIIYVNRSRGFVEGLWKGAIAGVATFIAIYLPSLGNHDSELIGGVVGSTIGGGIILVSPVVGAIIGHTEEFQFQSQ